MPINFSYEPGLLTPRIRVLVPQSAGTLDFRAFDESADQNEDQWSGMGPQWGSSLMDRREMSPSVGAWN